MSAGVIALLRELAEHEKQAAGDWKMLPDSPHRRVAVRDGFIVGVPMKVGHCKKYRLTEKGRAAL